MLHAMDPILDQLRTILERLYPATAGGSSFAASDAFTSYNEGKLSQPKITIVNAATHSTSKIELADVAPRFSSSQSTSDAPSVPEGGEGEKESEKPAQAEDSEESTQTYGQYGVDLKDKFACSTSFCPSLWLTLCLISTVGKRMLETSS